MSRCNVFYIVTFFIVLNLMSVTAVASQLQLTIDKSKIELPLSDFPVLIHLGTSSGQNAVDTSTVFSTLGSDSNRKKISVTTDSGGMQQLYVEIEKWDTANKQACLWVKVPSVSSSTNTTLYFNYGPDMLDNNNYVGDTGSVPATNVWNNGYVAVYHFTEQGTGVAGEYKDSTGKEHNGQGGGGEAKYNPKRVPSLIGDGGQYDGVDDFIKVNDSDDLSITTTNAFTVSVWWNCYSHNFTNDKPYNSKGFIHWLGKEQGDPYAVEWQLVLHQWPPLRPSGTARWYNFNSSGGLGAGANSYNSWQPGEWHYQTCETICTDSTHGQTDMWMEAANHNGTQYTWQQYGIEYHNTDAPLYIGNSKKEIIAVSQSSCKFGVNFLRDICSWVPRMCHFLKINLLRFKILQKNWYIVKVTNSNHNSWNGQIDELQISSVARSTAWIKASYYTDKDDLLIITVLSNNSSNETYPVANFSTNITSGTAPLSVQFTNFSKNAT